MKPQKKGFTIVELIVTIIIVAILAIAAVPVYQYNKEKAYLTEAFTTLRAIADANTLYYLEYGVWNNDIRKLPIQIDGQETKLDNMYRIETKNFIYAAAGDSATSNTIATVNRKPFKERYWFSFTSTPNKKKPELGDYGLNGDATYSKSKEIDRQIVAHYKNIYPK